MLSPVSAFFSVCLSARLLNTSQLVTRSSRHTVNSSHSQLVTYFDEIFGSLGRGPKTNRLDVGGDRNHDMDKRINLLSFVRDCIEFSTKKNNNF